MIKYFSFDNFNTFVKDIRRYLSSTKEVIIMDFHRFPSGFQVIFDTRLIPVIIISTYYTRHDLTAKHIFVI